MTSIKMFKKKEYSKDEIKLHIKRLQREVKELQNKYNTALLRSKEMFSKEHTIRDVMECFSTYGNPKSINFDIICSKRDIKYWEEILKITT